MSNLAASPEVFYLDKDKRRKQKNVFLRKPFGIFPPMSSNTHRFFLERFSSKRLSEQVECSFDNNSRMKFAQSPKKFIKLNFSSAVSFPKKVRPATMKAILKTLVENVSLKV